MNTTLLLRFTPWQQDSNESKTKFNVLLLMRSMYFVLKIVIASGLVVAPRIVGNLFLEFSAIWSSLFS